MLNKELITQAESQVRKYLEDNLLTKVKPEQKILDVLIKNAEESLSLAQDILTSNKSDLWVIVTSYYAMFYMANAVLYKKGLKVGDTSAHAVTANALIVYVRNSLKESLIDEFTQAMSEAQSTMKAEELLEAYFLEKKKRGDFQYNMTLTLKRAKAQTSFDRAKEFTFALRKLL
jgi:uncharacterized protein (UPF0332 family)